MQFFPYHASQLGVSAHSDLAQGTSATRAGGGAAIKAKEFLGFAVGKSGKQGTLSYPGAVKDKLHTVEAGANEFLASLNAALAAQGITPVPVQHDADSSLPKGVKQLLPVTGTLKPEVAGVLRETLRKRGISETNLESLDRFLSSGRPITLGGMIAALRNRSRVSSALTEEESLHLGSALRKLGFTQDETQDLEDMMGQGQNFAALRRIQERVASLDADKLVTLDAAEMNSLARGLEFSESTAKKTLAFLNDGSELSTDKQGLSAILSRADREFAAEEQGRQAVAKELPRAITEALQDARFQERVEAVADTRVSKRAAHSEIMMRDKLTAKSNQLGPEALAERARRLAAEAEGWAEEGDGQESLGKEARQEAERYAGTGTKVETREASPRREHAPVENNKLADALLSKIIPGGVFMQPLQLRQFAAAEQAPAGRNFQQEIFNQVEKGMLRELYDGSRQITLRLDPVELGQLTVQLSVYKGEVKARIRAENPETAAALSEQVGRLRASLEEQGLKVAQLDVQTQLREDPSLQQWDTAARHNKEQALREQARFIELSRMRREAGGALAQDMHISGMREEIAASGLHIIM